MIKGKVIFFFLLIIFNLPFVLSAPVTDLNINLVNSPPLLHKDLNFVATWSGGDANVLYWRFAEDGNVLVDGIGSQIIYLQDNFDVNNSTWNVTSGTWSYGSGELTQTASSGEIYNDSGQTNDYSSLGLIVEFEVGATNLGTSITDDTTIASSNGYRLTTAPGQYKLQTVVAGTTTDRLVINNAVGAGTIIKWTFDTNGLITGLRNGVPEGSVYDTNFNSFRYTIFDASMNAAVRDLNITSLAVDSFTIPSGASQTHTFNTAGQKIIELTVQNPDGNASTSLEITLPADTGIPVINVFDFNSTTGFNQTGIINFELQCTDNLSSTIDYNVTLNGVSLYSDTDANNAIVYGMNNSFNTGENILRARCTDPSGNTVTSSHIFSGISANFYFVYANTGVALSSGADYTAGDVNTLKVYSYDLNEFVDMKATGAVDVDFSGIGDDGLLFVITYTDPSFPTVTIDFDASVLDTNSVPVCFSDLFPFRQQIVYSSSVRDVIVKNALTECYVAAAKTEAAYQDAFQLIFYTVPMTYDMYLRTANSTTLLSLIDGSLALAHNLDLLIINSQADPEVKVVNDVLTANLFCQVADCNVLSVQYFSPENNSEVTLSIIQDGVTFETFTANSPDANSISFTWNFTGESIDKNNFFTLQADITRADGDIETITQLISLNSIQGFIEPAIALILSFSLFLFGITIFASRIALGWPGIIVVILSLSILSMAPGYWYIPVFQSVMLVVGLFLFLTYKNETIQGI